MPTDSLAESPRPPQEILADLLDHIRIVLYDTVHGENSEVSKELRDDFKAAWLTVEKSFRAVDKQLAQVKKESLSAVGLTDANLALKEKGLRRAFNRLARGATSGLKRRLRNFLGWSNTILGSLVKALPAVEIIKEFKECLENDLADNESSAA